MSRLAFHSVGVLPFLLGSILVWRMHNVFNFPLFLLGVSAVILIMLCTYYMGEYHDLAEDTLSASMERNTFSGGSQVIVKQQLPLEYPKFAAYVALVLTVVIGLIIQFYYKTGYLTIPLGCIGIICGFFYSYKPIRWVSRGIGEALIGFCYGWLPVAVAFYLQVGKIDDIVHWISLPIAFTIFNVILINEFPDYPADLMVSKKNLVVRFGKDRSAWLYIAMTVMTWLTVLYSVKRGLPPVTLLYHAPVFAVSFLLVIMMTRKLYLNRKLLEVMCALTIVTNLGTALAYILSVW